MRRLIVNADDFGRSDSINQAIIRAHRDGILTSASLMVNEPCCAAAVTLARENPKLGVGLHLALVCGRAALPCQTIPGLVDQNGNFTNNPVSAGCRYFFLSQLQAQLHAEMEAQFEKFHATGLSLDHVNGHLNIHLHPTVFKILMANTDKWCIRRVRLTDDRFRLSCRLTSGQWLYRASHAFIYRALSRRAKPILAAKRIQHTQNVFGLLQNARVDEAYVHQLLSHLPEGDSELYSHPSLDEFKHEFDALISPEVKLLVARSGIQLIRYQDL